jgi:hypothetical protein
MTASDKCTNLIKYVLLCRSHPHRTFAAAAPMAAFVRKALSSAWKLADLAHHWGRELRRLGHDVRLMPAAYVKPYVRGVITVFARISS